MSKLQNLVSRLADRIGPGLAIAERVTPSAGVVTLKQHGLIVHTYSAACSGCHGRLVNGPNKKGYPTSQLEGVILWAEFHSAECDRTSQSTPHDTDTS